MRHADLSEQPCSISRPLAVLGDRWTFVIVKQAFAGVRRFEDFQASLGISRGRLADRLQRLVEHDILRRKPYKDGRTRHEYRLTEKGLELYPILIAIRDWGDRHMAPDGRPVHYRHRGCGGEAHVELACDRCGEELGARDVEASPGPGALAAYDRPMGDEGDIGQWREGLRSMLESQDLEDRRRAAAMSVDERLELGVRLSMFAARMRSAFRDQSLAR